MRRAAEARYRPFSGPTENANYQLHSLLPGVYGTLHKKALRIMVRRFKALYSLGMHRHE
jgi:hypothetical protein